MKLPSFALHETEGPKTSELVRKPGRFGLGQVPALSAPDRTTTMVCGYCSTGCGLNIHLRENSAVNLTPTRDYPVNIGMACPKGWEALNALEADDRALSPQRRSGETMEAISWAEAAQEFVSRMRAVQEEHGPEAAAFLSTGQIATEEMAYLGAFAKFGMGMLHGDGNTRQCMATAVVAYKQSFGYDAPPYSYQDFEESDTLVFVGSNLCITHPIMWQRVLANRHNPKIIVLDPRKTETAQAATHHLALRPKGDLALLYAVANQLIRHGWVERDFLEKHCTGYQEFFHFLENKTPEWAEPLCGISREQIHQFAKLIHQGKRVSFWWTMGVNQGHEAVRTAQAIINLALMTGNIGKPGTGANSITGQCNAMGSRLYSNTTNLLGGHDFAKAQHRHKVARTLGIDAALIPERASDSYDQIIDGILEGKIKALWVIATNGAHSWIEQKRYHEAMEKLDFLVVQDIYQSTETAQHADLLLPAAGWGEKEGTFINSERRIGLLKKVRKAPGQALDDFHIFRLLSSAWGCAGLFKSWSSPEAVFQILKELSRDQPSDFSAIEGYNMLDEAGGMQWPFRREDAQAGLEQTRERRLFEDGRFYHPDGKARFHFEEPRTTAEKPNNQFPLLLLTGRGTSAQWHTQTRTAKSAILRKLYPEKIYAEVHPEDAKARGIDDHDRILIASPRAQIYVQALLTTSVQAGQIFLPMHYAEANLLTKSDFDPYSRQPSYKFGICQIQRA